MNVKQKFSFSVASLLVINLLLVVFFIISISQFRNIYRQNNNSNTDIENMLILSQKINDFNSNGTTLEDIISQFQTIRDTDSIPKVVKNVQFVDRLIKQNDSLENELLNLTEISIQQSSSFITQVSQKLADPYNRANVSTIERLVIIGANINTCTNYEIRNLFQKLKQDVSYSSSLISYIDTAIANANTDEKRLSNTKFANLPIVAKEANIKIKAISLKYIDNKNTINETIQRTLADINNCISYSVKSSAIQQRASQTKLLLLFAFILIISLFIVVFIYKLSKYISGFILKVNKNLILIAEGDLTTSIGKEDFEVKDELDEITLSLQKSLTSFRNVITQISTSAKQLGGASSQLNSASLELSQSTNEQSATTEEISSSMEEILATVQSNTEKSENTSKISSVTAKKMEKSKEMILQTLSSVSNISEKITIISEIADKTDILSINAAIEAARAGDAGRGFAVVAQEIRKLADTTQIAAKEIGELSKTNQNISQISSKQLGKIIPEIIRSAELVNDIVVGSKEQQSSIESINIAILQLTESTNENSASAEEMSASAEELLAQAEQLKELISIFKIEENEK